MKRVIIMLGLLVGAVTCGCALQAQTLTFEATALVRPISAYRFWSHRLDVGFRWHPCKGRVCGQLGALLVAENPLTIGDAGTLTQHVGGGMDVKTGKGWRVGASIGQFLLTSNQHNRPFDYYRFLALGIEHDGPMFFRAEAQVYHFDAAAFGAAAHEARVVWQYEIVSVDAGYVMALAPQRYGFLVGTLRFQSPRGYFVQVGTHPMIALDGSLRQVQNQSLDVGYQWRTRP